MKAKDIIKEISSFSTVFVPKTLKIGENTVLPDDLGKTCDTKKIGDENKEVKKVAVCCIATIDVIKAAHKWGADLLITHEPTFYDHYDEINSNIEAVNSKLELLKSTGMTVYRYHDLPHLMTPDIIGMGELTKLGWEGTYNGVNTFEFDKAISPREMAKDIKTKLNLGGVRLIGDGGTPVKRVLTLFGACDVPRIMNEIDADVIICGEVSEWKAGEQIRDEAQLGRNRSMIILGHMGSERDGMEYLANMMKERFTEFETAYFDCGELYEYI